MLCRGRILRKLRRKTDSVIASPHDLGFCCMQQETALCLLCWGKYPCAEAYVFYIRSKLAIDGINLSLLLHYAGERIPGYAVTGISSYTQEHSTPTQTMMILSTQGSLD